MKILRANFQNFPGSTVISVVIFVFLSVSKTNGQRYPGSMVVNIQVQKQTLRHHSATGQAYHQSRRQQLTGQQYHRQQQAGYQPHHEPIGHQVYKPPYVPPPHMPPYPNEHSSHVSQPYGDPQRHTTHVEPPYGDPYGYPTRMKPPRHETHVLPPSYPPHVEPPRHQTHVQSPAYPTHVEPPRHQTHVQPTSYPAHEEPPSFTSYQIFDEQPHPVYEDPPRHSTHVKPPSYPTYVKPPEYPTGAEPPRRPVHIEQPSYPTHVETPRHPTHEEPPTYEDPEVQETHRETIYVCNTPQGNPGTCKPMSQCRVSSASKRASLSLCDIIKPEHYYCCPDGKTQNQQSLSDLISGIISPVLVSVLGDTSTTTKSVPTRYSTPIRTTRATTRAPTRATTRSPTKTTTRSPSWSWSSTRLPTRASPVWSWSSTRSPTRAPSSTTTESYFHQPPPEISHGSMQVCGHRGAYGLNSRRLDGFVLGGKDSEEHSWPWMVSVYKAASNGQDNFFCGGSLIGTRHVLTAAHCFDSWIKGQVSSFSVGLGSNDLLDIYGQSYSRPRHVGVDAIHVHEKYTPKVYYHDIAVLTLSENISFDRRITPVCLPTVDDTKMVAARTGVMLTGWGHTSYGGSQSLRLQEAQMQIYPLSRCKSSYDSLRDKSIFKGLTVDMLCANGQQKAADACQGDSGGPLVLDNQGRWIQVGIVSFGYKCGEPEFPGVYTRVASYIDWIHRTMAKRTYNK